MSRTTPIHVSPIGSRKQRFAEEQETRRQVLSLLDTYVHQETEKTSLISVKMGVVGLLKEISDLVLETPSLRLLHAREQYDLMYYVYDTTITYLTRNNMGGRHAIMLSMNPLAMKCVQYIDEAFKKDQLDDSERDDAEALQKRVLKLRFPLERVQLAYDLAVEELLELVRLGDRYIRLGLWEQSELAYQEGYQLLMCLARSDVNSIDSLARLVVIGYGRALFGQCKFIEASDAYRLGLHFFPSFPTLPFNPINFYKSTESSPLDRTEDYMKTLQDLRDQISILEQMKNATETDVHNLHKLVFVQAFECYFINKKEESIKLFEELKAISKHETEEFTDFTPEILFFTNPKKITPKLTSSEKSNDFLTIDMNDRSMRQLQVWTKRLFDPKVGIEIKPRKWRLRTYEPSFICSEAVTFISKNGEISRTDAVDFLQRLMNRYVMRHVHDEHMIEDAYLFFAPQLSLVDIVFDPVLYEGYLLKKSGIKWTKRYTALYPKAMVLFESGPGSKAKKIIPLDGGQVVLGLPNGVVLEKNEDSSLFNLTIGLDVENFEPGNVISFSTERDDRTEWVKAFQKIPHLRVQIYD